MILHFAVIYGEQHIGLERWVFLSEALSLVLLTADFLVPFEGWGVPTLTEDPRHRVSLLPWTVSHHLQGLQEHRLGRTTQKVAALPAINSSQCWTFLVET